MLLSDDPGREVIIPITATGLGGAIPADYSGVPQTVTFGRAAECFDSVGDIIQGGICYETTADITIAAAQDDDDDGERVLLGFGAPLPAGVSAGWPATETVTISDGGLAFVGLAQVGIGVTAAVAEVFGNVSNEAWQWQRSATEYGAYSDIAAAEGGTSNPYTPSAGDLGMWLKAKITYDVGSRTGQTAQATTLQPVLSQAALSNAGFAHANELSYVLDTPPATPITPLYAQGFTTGSASTNGYLLTAVRLAIRLHGLTAAGAWAVHADDAGKPAAQPLSAARPILNTAISPEHFTFREFAHPDGVRVDPDTKYCTPVVLKPGQIAMRDRGRARDATPGLSFHRRAVGAGDDPAGAARHDVVAVLDLRGPDALPIEDVARGGGDLVHRFIRPDAIHREHGHLDLVVQFFVEGPAVHGLRLGNVVEQHLLHGVSRYENADPARLYAGNLYRLFGGRCRHNGPLGWGSAL